ncbi:MAG: hypothetical protein ACT4PL_12690 [Phycisphaerales bacterium]
MLAVYLDDIPINAPSPAAGFQMAADRARNAGRLIVEATLNGAPAPEEVLDGDLPAEGELRLTSADPGQLVGAVLRSAAAELEGASTAQRDAAIDLGRGDLAEAVNRLGTITAAWDKVQRAAVQGSAVLESCGRPQEAAAMHAALAPCSTGLAKHLVELRRALGTEDWSALADVLEGDLEDSVAQWQEVLLACADGAQAAQLAPTAQPAR